MVMETGAGWAHPVGNTRGEMLPGLSRLCFASIKVAGPGGNTMGRHSLHVLPAQESQCSPQTPTAKGGRISTKLLERDSQEMEFLKSWRKWSSWHGAELGFLVDLCWVERKKSPSKEPLLSRQKAAPWFEQSLEQGGKFSQKHEEKLPIPLCSPSLVTVCEPSVPAAAVRPCWLCLPPIPSHPIPLPHTNRDKRSLGQPPQSTHSHQADPPQACSQKSCWFFFSQPFLSA